MNHLSNELTRPYFSPHNLTSQSAPNGLGSTWQDNNKCILCYVTCGWSEMKIFVC